MQSRWVARARTRAAAAGASQAVGSRWLDPVSLAPGLLCGLAEHGLVVMIFDFVFVGAEMPQGAVCADGVVEGFDVVEDGETGLVSCLEDVAVEELCLMVPMADSMRALSNGSPTRPMLGMMPALRRVRLTKRLPYWAPRSE